MPFPLVNFKLRPLAMLLTLACAAAPAPAEELALSASPSGLVGNSAEVGSPLWVTVRLDVAGSFDRPVPLPGAPADWRQVVAVELIRGSEEALVARGQPVGPAPEVPAQVDPEAGLSGRWFFPADLLATVGAGEYQLRARLDRGAAEPLVSTWPLSLVASQSGPEQTAQRSLSAAASAALAGDAARARTLLNAALQTESDHYELLIARGQLALSEGDFRAASFCLRRAAAVVARGTGERPPSLHAFAEQLRALSAESAADQGNSGPIDLPPALLLPLAPPPNAVNSGNTTSGNVALVGDQSKTGPARKGAKFTSPPARFELAGANKLPAAPSSAPTPSIPTSRPSPVATKSPTTTPGTPAMPAAPAPSVPAVDAPPAETGSGSVVPAAQLADAAIIADTRGRWAASATASGSYGKDQYGPQQAAGAPNTPVAGNSPKAWCSSRQSRGLEWLEVTFAEAASASGVRIRQNNVPGTIVRVEAIDDSGVTHLWWAGRDPLPRATVRQITWFGIDVAPTTYRVSRVRITLDLDILPDWKQIDAVQLIASGP